MNSRPAPRSRTSRSGCAPLPTCEAHPIPMPAQATTRKAYDACTKGCRHVSQPRQHSIDHERRAGQSQCSHESQPQAPLKQPGSRIDAATRFKRQQGSRTPGKKHTCRFPSIRHHGVGQTTEGERAEVAAAAARGEVDRHRAEGKSAAREPRRVLPF